MPSTKLLASWPVTDIHWSMLMPCDCSWRTVRLDPPLQVALHERLGRLDLGEPGQRLGDPADELLAGLVRACVAESRSRIDARHSSTVSNSPMLSATHSSVTSGSDELLHGADA